MADNEIEELGKWTTSEGNEVTLIKNPIVGPGLVMTVYPTEDMPSQDKFAVYLDIETLASVGGALVGYTFRVAFEDMTKKKGD